METFRLENGKVSLTALAQAFDGNVVVIKNRDAISNAKIVEHSGDRFCIDLSGVMLNRLVTDSRDVEKNDVFLVFKGKAHDGEEYISDAFRRGAGAVICTCGASERIMADGVYIEVADVAASLQRAARLVRLMLGDVVVGITGSTGKTTVKEFSARMLSERASTAATVGNHNNALGLPLTVLNAFCDSEIVPEHGNSPKILVLEMGVSCVGDMDVLYDIAKPDIAVITNIGYMHIANFKTRRAIAEEKLKLIGNTVRTVIFDGSDGMLCELLCSIDKIRRIPVCFSEARRNVSYTFSEWLTVERFGISETGNVFSLNGVIDGRNIDVNDIELSMTGRHMVYDCAVAAAVALVCGCETDDIKRGARGYVGDALRQNITEKDGIVRMVDCYNSGPSSVRAALAAMDEYAELYGARRRVAVLGSMLELGDISDDEHIKLGEELADYGVERLFTVGKDAEKIAFGAVKRGFLHNNVTSFSDNIDYEYIKKSIDAELKAGDMVLYKGSRGLMLEKLL